MWFREILRELPDKTEEQRPRIQDRRNLAVIAMHCPSCGAEGRIPREKVNQRLICKKCLKTFHLTLDERVLPGPPPHDEDEEPVHHETPGHEFDHVDEEIDLVMKKIRETLPKVAIALGLLVAALIAWPIIRGRGPVGLADQATAVARALAHNDPNALRSITIDPAAAKELSEAVQKAFQGRTDIVQSTSPMVEVSRKPESPGPGLAEVTTAIKPESAEGRSGLSVHDISTDNRTASSVDIPLVLSGDDRSGWRLDAGRSLEAYRKATTPVEPPTLANTRGDGARSGKSGATGRRNSSSPNSPPTSTARPGGAPRA